MREWLLEIVRKLRQMSPNSALDNGKRMASVLSIIVCFGRLMPRHIEMDEINNEDIRGMVTMLHLIPDVEQKTCFDYVYVKKVIKPEVKKVLTDTITSFCLQLHYKTTMSLLQWFEAVPLLHFLQEVIQPFGDPELDPKKIKWNVPPLDHYSLQTKPIEFDVK